MWRIEKILLKSYCLEKTSLKLYVYFLIKLDQTGSLHYLDQILNAFHALYFMRYLKCCALSGKTS